MITPIRPIDQAMAENRPAKGVIRSRWVEEVKEVARQHPNSEVPWFLTLGGAEGHDIQLIIEAGLISLTEVNSIAEKDLNKIVAVERNNQAVLALQKKFTGLRIKQVDFRSLIRGEGQFAWPDGEDIECCRARVINLDFDISLSAHYEDGHVSFPVLEWIRKLSQIHARPPRTDWTLCLTLHGEVVWPENVSRWTKTFLRENLRREPVFAENCKEFFGEELLKYLIQDDDIDFATLDREDQQKFFMVMVPKIITKLVHNEGWKVRTELNLRYGEGNQAPMVTWIVKFTWDGNATATPDTLYRTALCEILSNAGVVTDDGNIVIEYPKQD